MAIQMAAAGWKTLLVNADMKKKKGTDTHADRLEMGLTHYL
jgi:hypothetical protein